MTALDIGASRYDHARGVTTLDFLKGMTSLEEFRSNMYIGEFGASLRPILGLTRLRTLSLYLGASGVEELAKLQHLPLEYIIPLKLLAADESMEQDDPCCPASSYNGSSGFTDALRKRMQLLPPRIRDALDRGMHVRRSDLRAATPVGRWPVDFQHASV